MTILATTRDSVRPVWTPPHYNSWQEAMKDAIRDPAELCRQLGLPRDFADQVQRAYRGFPLFVPRGFVARMAPGDPHDPLLRQVIPLPAENEMAVGFGSDPVGDRQATREPGLIQKYDGRVLLTVTGACAVHCRYCFRQHYPYEMAPGSMSDWEGPLNFIANDESIHEVILSGGDPLTIVDEPLAKLAARLAAIGHVRRLRVHTRLPVVLPQRVTKELLQWLTGTRLTPIVVIHANHARELTDDVPAAISALVETGVVMLNQAVLLQGVNDSAKAQAELCERLVDLRVMPYYLHQLDRVAGAAHFEVPVERGREIMEALRMRLPGYAVPRYAMECAGQSSKTILA